MSILLNPKKDLSQYEKGDKDKNLKTNRAKSLLNHLPAFESESLGDIGDIGHRKNKVIYDWGHYSSADPHPTVVNISTIKIEDNPDIEDLSKEILYER